MSRMNEVANRLGAWIANEVGAMPVPKPGFMEKLLSYESFH